MKKKVKSVKIKIKASNPKKVKSKKSSINDLGVLEVLTTKLFDLMGVSSKADFREDKENDALLVDVRGESETGLLIGARGRTLASLQTLLGLMFRQKTGIWKRIIVNVERVVLELELLRKLLKPFKGNIVGCKVRRCVYVYYVDSRFKKCLELLHFPDKVPLFFRFERIREDNVFDRPLVVIFYYQNRHPRIAYNFFCV